MVEVKLPDDMDGLTTAVISIWRFSEGDSVRKDEDLVEITTDKAVFNIPSPITGKVVKINFIEGDTVNSGDVLATLE